MADELQDSGAVFPIGELSQRTGINSITLRAWERRYGLLQPQRTAKGHRLYNQADVELVQRTLALIERGVPLRKIRPLLAEDAAGFLSEPDENAQHWQHVLFEQLARANQSGLAARLQELFKQYPVSWCRNQVLLPLFARLAGQEAAAALEALLQAELISYGLRYWPQNRGKQQPCLQVLGGVPTASWRSLLLALELQERRQNVQWLPGA